MAFNKNELNDTQLMDCVELACAKGLVLYRSDEYINLEEITCEQEAEDISLECCDQYSDKIVLINGGG